MKGIQLLDDDTVLYVQKVTNNDSVESVYFVTLNKYPYSPTRISAEEFESLVHIHETLVGVTSHGDLEITTHMVVPAK